MSVLEKRLFATYIAVAIFFVPVYSHFVSPAEFSRWLAVSALVEEHSLDVSRRLPLIGGQIEDLSEFENRLYSNKAPGAAIVSIPGYLAARLFVGPTSFRVVLTAMRFCASTAPLLLLALALLRLARRWGTDSGALRVALCTSLFATPLFSYSLLLFSHVLTAAALFGVWMLLFTGERTGARDAAAGALVGLAVISEYPSVVPAATLVIIACRLEWRRLLLIASGGLPFALLLAAYNFACFGSPFELSSAHERLGAFNELAGQGVFGVGVPSPMTAVRLLFSPERGLFFFSPVLIPGLIALYRQRHDRASFAALLAACSIVLFYAGYPNWHGGWTVGARYLVPVVPFLAAGLLRRTATPLDDLLLCYSVTAVTLTTVIFPFVPEDFAAPWGTFALPILLRGMFAIELLRVLGIVVVIAATLFVIGSTRWKNAALGGVLLALVVGFLALYASTPRNMLERAYIADVYLEREGELERIGAPRPLLERAARERRLPPQPLSR